MNTDEQIHTLTRAYYDTMQSVLAARFDFCESPIERLLFIAILDSFVVELRSISDAERHELRETMLRYGLSKGQCVASAPDAIGYNQLFRSLLVQPELRLCTEDGVRLIRLDFAIVARHMRIAIEADGHDFHERTKEQAARDRSRDRLLTRNQWRVLRFTGSEIVRDPQKCAYEIESVVLAEEMRDAG